MYYRDEVSETRFCDFCGQKRDKFFMSDEDEDRDICEHCVKEAADLMHLNYANNPSLTTMLTAMLKRVLDKDTKTLVKAGYLNKDLTLTHEGEEELMAILLTNSKEELVKLAQEKIEEEKEAKK